MEYAPKLPEENVNVSKSSPLVEFALMVAGLLVLVFLVYWTLGFAIDWAVDRMTPEQEEALSLNLDFEGFGKAEELDTPQSRQLQKMIDQMQSQCSGLPSRLRVVYLPDSTINAVALPGGIILVFQGLVEEMKSENALAFVLGHEMGHFKNRDHLKALGRGLVLLTLWSLVGGDSSALGDLISPSLTSANARHSQIQESEADAFGLNVVQCRYGHVSGATQFFETMQKQEDRGVLDPFFESHPGSPDRIEHLHTLSEQGGFGEGPLTPLPPELLAVGPAK